MRGWLIWRTWIETIDDTFRLEFCHQLPEELQSRCNTHVTEKPLTLTEEPANLVRMFTIESDAQNRGRSAQPSLHWTSAS
jgi:hypothetical protein